MIKNLFYQNNGMDTYITSIHNLPEEILFMIINDIDLEDYGPLLKLVCKRFKKNIPVNSRKDDIVLAAISDGYENLIYWLYHNKCVFDINICYYAAKYNQVSILKWLISKNYIYDNKSLLEIAVDNGCLDVIKYLHKQMKIHINYSNVAAENGDKVLLEWFLNNGIGLHMNICNYAAESGNYFLLKWLISLGYPSNEDTLYHACRSGNLVMCEELFAEYKKQNKKLPSYLYDTAAGSGHIKVIHLLEKYNCQFDLEELGSAGIAGKGNLDIVKWAVSKGAVLDAVVFGFSASGGDTKLMEWFEEQGCPMAEETFYYAATTASVEVLKWLKEKECPWSERVLDNAAAAGNDEAVKFLINSGCPCDENTYMEPVKNNHLSILACLKNKIPLTSNIMTHAINCSNYEVILWLISNKCPMDEECGFASIVRQDVKLVNILVKYGCPWNENICLKVLESKNKNVIRFLNQIKCPCKKEHQ